jgi:signal transduction histidine kinase
MFNHRAARMKLNYRQRFTLVISAYTFFLVFVALTALWLMFETIEGDHDRNLEQAFNEDISIALEKSYKDQSQVITATFNLYYDTKALPEHLKKYNKFGFQQLALNEQVIVGQHPKSGDKYYLLLHSEEKESFLMQELFDIFFVVTAAILISFTVVFLVLFMAKKLTSPVVELQDVVKNIDIDSDQLPLLDREDEIGELSNHFSELISKMRKFAQRERDFTRFSSHELRTPITVIKGNFDLLDKTIPKNDLNSRVLLRMDTAISRMSNLVEVFLWLGREDKTQHEFVTESLDKLRLKSLFEQALDTIPQLEKQHIEVKIDEIQWQLKPVMLSMLIDNLLRNALQHGDKSIKITATLNQLCISNKTLQEIDFLQQGIGLQIVQRISDANNWHLHIETSDQQFKASLVFPETVPRS